MYTIKRSHKRLRTTALSVSSTGQIIVTAPIWVPKKVIDEFIASKSDWIAKQLTKIKPTRSLKYIHSELHLYFGEKYPLNFRAEQKRAPRHSRPCRQNKKVSVEVFKRA